MKTRVPWDIESLALDLVLGTLYPIEHSFSLFIPYLQYNILVMLICAKMVQDVLNMKMDSNAFVALATEDCTVKVCG